MAEEESELELDRFKKELESLLKTSASDERGLQSKTYCGRFCELVEEQTGRWQVPLPQLQVLQGALCSFVQGAASFPPDCEHVRYTLSSLALSVFELLLFFGKDEFLEHPLKDILDSFQDCYTSLVRHQNVYLLQVRHIIKDGGPWANPVLQAILKESELPQEDVDRYLSSEVSVFFELRVRYLLACERLPEAMALSKRCSQHSVAGRHRYFMQAYLTCLLRTSLYERLYKEMADIDGRDAVDILCSTENEAKDEIVLMLSKGFLSQQLQNGDMYYLWDLVFIWSRLCLRVNPSKQGFLEECKLMILSAINIKAIFPFMKVILAEVGRDGLTFCVELCAQALQTDLKNDPVTKSLIYKTIAYLLPNDLEICRACALLVFFLERTVEAYRTVFLLYTHPDQEYHADISLVGNSVRFEVLQVLKKGLYFDPEFWNLLNIETNCRKLMSDKVAEADLCEIMQKDNWVPSYCMKGHCQCHTDNIDRIINNVEKHTNRNGREQETKQFTSVSNETSSKLPRKKRRRKPEMELVDDLEDFPVRRSFRQLDLEKNHPRTLNSRRQRFLAQQAERNTLKRRGRKPQCLVEELAVQAENGVPRKGKKPGRKPKQSNVLTELSIDEPLSEITIKLSYPDNEVDLPTDVQASLFSFETSQMTESSNDKTKIESQEYLKRPSGSTTSPVDISVESTPCSKELFGDREEIVSQEQELFMVRKFHTYSRAAEFEETPVSVPRDNVVTTNPNDSKQESLLQSYELQSEPAETPESDTQVKTIVQIEDTQIPSTNLETSTPVEVTDLPIEALHLEPKPNPELSSAQAADCIHPENTVSVENPANNSVDLPPEITTLNTTDTIPIADSVTQENMADLHENGPPVLTEETRVSDDAPAFGSETEIAAPPKIVPVNMEEKELPPVPEEVSQNIHAAVDSLVPNLMPLDVAGHRFTLKCSLCNKDTKDPNILHHAQWHFRIDKKCMFCYKRYTYGRRPSIHFKRHIQELKKSNDPFRKNKKKFENNKMRLKTRLDIADLNKKQDSLEPKVRLRTRLSKNSHPASTLDERKEKVCRKGRRVRTILARRSETRDENKKTFRMRLASRRARTMQAKTPVEDHSNAKGNSAHRVNGVVRKRRKVARVQEVTSSNRKVQATLTQENGEPKTENVECAEGSATPDEVETKSQNLPDPDIKHGSKMQGKEDENMTLNTELIKTIRPEDEGDVVAVKRRKTTNSHNECSDNQEHKENTITPEDINAVEHKNGINAKPRVRSVPFQGRRTGTSTEVRCPVEICTFSAKSILVLSHVLSHHQGDKKALVFFFNFGKEKCLFCSRKVFNPEHFFDHVVCHKGELKHPCLHQGCKERFQTRLELNDHMLGHHPLRAMCCFPGCPMLADSVMHLYKHEKTHYRLDAKWEQNPLPKMTDPTGQRAPSKQEDGTEVKPESTNSSVGELNGGTAKQTCPTSAGQDDDGRPLVLNKSSISYSGKNHGLVNGHVQNESSTKASNPVTKPQEPSGSRKPTTKAFIRPPPSAYLDESHISMPKRWKEPQTTSKTLGSVSSTATPSTRQRCSRCFVSFSSEEELQTHKDKCTSLFGFDSDDESAS